MRLPLIAPADLTAEQRPVYDVMRYRKEFPGIRNHRC
jgi:hypothetical protein